MPDISNPVALHCVAPGGAGAVAGTGGLQPLEVGAGPVELVEGDKSKPEQVSRRHV